MDRKVFSPVLVALALIILDVIGLIGAQVFGALQASPASQFTLARWSTARLSRLVERQSILAHEDARAFYPDASNGSRCVLN